jgi:hypothetical protein
MPKPLSPNWDIPEGLCRAGLKAAEALRDYCIKHKLTYAGSRVFYTPDQWKQRGEKYGTDSLLVCVYDGAECRRALALSGEDYRHVDAFAAILNDIDVFAEECTGWYAAIYNA